MTFKQNNVMMILMSSLSFLFINLITFKNGEMSPCETCEKHYFYPLYSKPDPDDVTGIWNTYIFSTKKILMFLRKLKQKYHMGTTKLISWRHFTA